MLAELELSATLELELGSTLELDVRLETTLETELELDIVLALLAGLADEPPEPPQATIVKHAVNTATNLKCWALTKVMGFSVNHERLKNKTLKEIECDARKHTAAGYGALIKFTRADCLGVLVFIENIVHADTPTEIGGQVLRKIKIDAQVIVARDRFIGSS